VAKWAEPNSLNIRVPSPNPKSSSSPTHNHVFTEPATASFEAPLTANQRCRHHLRSIPEPSPLAPVTAGLNSSSIFSSARRLPRSRMPLAQPKPPPVMPIVAGVHVSSPSSSFDFSFKEPLRLATTHQPPRLGPQPSRHHAPSFEAPTGRRRCGRRFSFFSWFLRF